MPLAFALALAASLGIHVAALFGTDVELFGGGDEPVTLQAELQPPPPPPAAAKPAESKPADKKAPARKLKSPVPPAKPAPLATTSPAPVAIAPSEIQEIEPKIESTAGEPVLPPTASAQPSIQPLLPARGTIRFVIYYGTQGFQVGRAEHRWEFTEDGRYRLNGMTETTGLVGLFRSLRFENESAGRLVAGGLQPERYLTRKNGKDANENAEFDWSAAAVRLSRDGSTREIARGTQDILSLNYQLAYVSQPENGARIGVVTGKKYERYALDSLGEETLDTPAGQFRTLHLRAMTDSVTEIWLALDRHRLPVKIRFTDRKGDVYEQVATEIGVNATPDSTHQSPRPRASDSFTGVRQEITP